MHGGASFFVIAAYAPRLARVDRLSILLAERSHENRSAAHRAHAENLILRDESEPGQFGQDVRKTYPLGDLFVNVSSVKSCDKEVHRFIDLIFGEPWRTPEKDEQGMSFAYLASLRSGSPARQVGAALTDSDGSIQSIGTNEVASPSGGQYWEDDPEDGRDVAYDRYDKSDRMRGNLLADVLSRLRALDVLKGDESSDQKLLEPGSASQLKLREAQLFDTIDFVRAVHAEAAALLTAKGRTKGTTLYVTTFPCHECARHIVFSGVYRVVYIEPYPKSLVSELYRDSIAVDPDEEHVGKVNFVPFSGVSPSVYQHLFSLTKKQRKEKDGKLIKWSAVDSKPRLHISYSQRATTLAETEVLGDFQTVLDERGRSHGGSSSDA